jgi:hypothetical protein
MIPNFYYVNVHITIWCYILFDNSFLNFNIQIYEDFKN